MSRLYGVLVTLAFIGVISIGSLWKGYQLGVKITNAAVANSRAERAESVNQENVAIVTERKKVNHENQNRDRAALIANGCMRGWVRDFENCPTGTRPEEAGSVRHGVFRHSGHDRNDPPKFNE